MSTNVKKCGFSIPLKLEEKQLKKVCDKLGQDYDEYDDGGFYPNFDSDIHLKKWIVVSDYNGVHGLVKVIHYEYDAFDLEFSVSMFTMSEVYMELLDLLSAKKIDAGVLDGSQFKTFSLLYYNGSDEPFKF